MKKTIYFILIMLGYFVAIAILLSSCSSEEKVAPTNDMITIQVSAATTVQTGIYPGSFEGDEKIAEQYLSAGETIANSVSKPIQKGYTMFVKLAASNPLTLTIKKNGNELMSFQTGGGTVIIVK
jgi:hypothetical protein